MTEDPTAKAFAQIIATVSPGVLKDYPQPVVPETVSHASVNPTQETRMAATSKMKAENVKTSSWTENLGPDEYVAVDDTGNVISRSDKATLERTHPNAALFGAKDFPKSVLYLLSKGVENPMLVNPPAGVPTTPSGHPVSDALADDPTPEPGTRSHPLGDGTPYEGPAALEPNDPSLNKIAGAKGEPIKDALKAAHDASTEAENAGRHAKTDELQAAQVDALEKDGAFDHDGNGKPGSKKGADSTASKGKAKKTAAKK